MGMKFNFKFEILENFYKGFPRKKKFPWEFFVNLIHIKILRDFFYKNTAGGQINF